MSGRFIRKHFRLNKYLYVRPQFILQTLCKGHFACDHLMLDAGSGSDVCSLSHVPETMNVIGLDLSRRNISESKSKARGKNFEFLVASITALPFKEGAFDLVICVDVLEHVEAKRCALRELSNVTKRGGYLVGSTSNMLNPVMLLDTLAPTCLTQRTVEHFSVQHYERHGRSTPSRLIKTLKEAGYSQIHLYLVANPSFRWWLYQSSERKLPWYAYLWIAYNKLTEKRPLLMLKETMMFSALKDSSSVG